MSSSEHDVTAAGAADKPVKRATRLPYMRPTLKRLGNVHDVLGKTGPRADLGRRNPQRP